MRNNETSQQVESCDVLIVGAGIAGLTAALELCQQGKRVVILERQGQEMVGGLARCAFGGMALVGTEEQKRNGIDDNADIALQDWYNFADFNDDDDYPKQWAQLYCQRSYQDVYLHVKQLGIKFLPAVNWVERGMYGDGNSLPRYHVMWGTSLELVNKTLDALSAFKAPQLTIKFEHSVDRLTTNELDHINGCIATTNEGVDVTFEACNVIIASGGFTGNLDMVKAHWPVHWQKPTRLLNGTSPSCDGKMHDEVARHHGRLTHLDKMWNYAAGIPHPEPLFEQHGLSLIPCKSALWLDANGERIGPQPLVTGFDTRDLCKQMAKQQHGYAWQVLNWKIASKEFAISGAEHNQMIRDKKFVTFIKETLLGNHRLVKQMQQQSDHFIVADTVSELVSKMNQLADTIDMDETILSQTLTDYDANLARPSAQFNDDQIRRIEHARKWKADRLRTCKPHPIQDSKHGPLIAIKVSLISRKSLGGIQTNIYSQVISNGGEPLANLYAIGEAAGFGGGGASGKRSLEGTFLSGCILTAKQAAKHICQSNINE
ncbi:FAD-binding dehydrogenase [Thalassotalea sp. Y01]|uniref:FAD-binding dehydrogenase n=1 Tax=Thalassotalea sp. Y01 TaxID=2729613 RepID=UPI00145E33D7|nr:FAD-binding dehydrogenase [Thalassotalea sp. Y01]NMP16645.1 FAD-binding dehydrogenase [Thalassotalea sp. Y01]